MKRVLEHLEALVAMDSRNPPREIDEAFFARFRQWLGPKFDVHVTDHGAGCVSLLAVRGEPRRLFNVHLDTVPAADGYSADPHTLRLEHDRAVGLGACDIKGAAAAMLAAAEVTTGPVAFLFTSDEEAGNSTCVRSFCHDGGPFDDVIVAEPTNCLAVVEHRGIQTATAVFRGTPGHASSGRANEDSAVHHAVRWAHTAMERARGLRFNLGRIEGGQKPNMIAGQCRVRFGFRPAPGMRGPAMLEELWGCEDPHQIEIGFTGPSLPPDSDTPAATELVAELGLQASEPVDFWTEAALFSDAGFRALVYGPGDIAQAHTADEWVALSQLSEAFDAYKRWFTVD